MEGICKQTIAGLYTNKSNKLTAPLYVLEYRLGILTVQLTKRMEVDTENWVFIT